MNVAIKEHPWVGGWTAESNGVCAICYLCDSTQRLQVELI